MVTTIKELFNKISYVFRENKSFTIKQIVFTSLLFIGSISYLFVNRFNAARFIDVKPFIWEFPIDSIIPFNRIFILPYYYWYFYIALTVILLFLNKNVWKYFAFIMSMALGALVCSFIFIIFPTYVPRTELVGSDFLTAMVRQIYAIDLPYNCFPSLHVVYAFICSWYLFLFNSKSKIFSIFIIISFILISLSTVFTKQHYTPDILGGIVVGALVCSIFTFSGISKRIVKYFSK